MTTKTDAHIAEGLRGLAVAVSSLDELEGNPRVGDVPAVVRSFERFGQRQALVGVKHGRRGTIIDGNHRLKAAREMGWSTVAVVWVKDDPETARAYALAANRTGDLASYDDALLAEMLQSISDPDLLLATGYGDDDLAALLASLAPPVVGLTDPDAVPDPPVEPVSKRGDVWLLGPHRVMCGDATQVDDYGQVLGGEHPVGALVSDPPYGVAIGAKNRALDSIDRADRVLTDLEGDQGIEEVEKLWRDSFGAFYQVLPPGCPYYVFGPQGGDLGLLLLLLLLRDSRLQPRHILIWVKNRPSFSIGRLDYDYQHEPIVYGWRPGGSHPWHADGTRTSILYFDRPHASPLHPTAKPVDLLAHLIDNSTKRGGVVLDPFAGSGSTLIACHQTGRVARLMEIDPHYVDVICRRFQDFTGEKPILESTGEPHDFTQQTP